MDYFKNPGIFFAGKSICCYQEAHIIKTTLEQLQTAVPDVILLDLMMPGMNGFEFIKELDRQGKRLAIPIIVLSASMLGQDLTPMYVSAYLSKPFSMKTLLDKVRQCVRSPLPQA